MPETEPRSGSRRSCCTVPACERPAYARGWCELHYRRWLRTGRLRPELPPRVEHRRRCDVAGCDGPHDARGLCHGHLQRLLRSGSVQAEIPLRGERGRCSVAGCDRDHHARGLCHGHYQRWRSSGDVDADEAISTPLGRGWITHGYRGVMVPDDLLHLTDGERQTTEHRLVMARYLGRPLRATEVVHHRNGDKLDNRIENLELWDTSHPKGQRVPDKVRHARAVLRRYAPHLLHTIGDN